MSTEPGHRLNDTDYERFRGLLLERSGLHFPDNKRRDLDLGLRNAMNDAGIDDLDVYYRRLAGGTTTDPTWESLIQYLTIGETYFFRNAAHFDALRNHILPELIAERRRNGLRMLRLWSAGCSTGEEPYSLAILLRQLIPDIDDWHIMILATDINRESLMAAQRGIYRPWSFRTETPSYTQEMYFTRLGNRFEIKPEIRRMVSFAYLNLAREGYPSVESHTVGMDLVMCRNVTIYFDKATTQAVIGRLQAALLDWGWLVVGHSELGVIDYEHLFAPRPFKGAVIYQKMPASPPQPEPARSISPTIASPLPPAAKKTPGRRPPRQVAAQPGQDGRPPTPDPAPLDRYQMALALADSGQLEQARAHLHALLKENPRHAPACWLMGKLYADQQEWDRALEWLQKTIEIDQLLAQAHYLIGLVYEEQELIEEAVTAFKRALYADHNFILGHFSLGNLYRAVGMVKDACRHWSNAADLLYHMASDDVIPFSDGLTVRRLLPVIQARLSDDLSECNNRAGRSRT
ncbi:MAG: tetratricopeptide repeat protein [Anaerolineae bacterium]|nr:tetratricopeptide repeat protein [Anaerolineae bacterium]